MGVAHDVRAGDADTPPARLLRSVSGAGTGPGALAEVWERHGFPAATAVTEHLHGVVPLLDLFGDGPSGLSSDIRLGRRLAALGLFTPNSLFSMPASAVHGRAEGDRIVLAGRFRYAAGHAEVSVVQVDTGDDVRLALLPHTLDGLTPRTANGPGTEGWADLDGAVLAREELSRPVTWEDSDPLVAAVDAYAWTFVRYAYPWSLRLISDLRRLLAETESGAGADVLSTSQYIAHELTRAEIEAVLSGAAAAAGPGAKDEGPGGQSTMAVLLSCLDLLQRASGLSERMAEEFGLPRGSAVTSARALFGGRRMVEGELARRMGLGRHT
ncbi:hypothetical protein [Nocardiopsis sp. LOL_012]|uniref:hypothetical protein n=1 Tax=Nocardiopsis sp. LOL_012 TaxID=3345409 RepID=UPI003A8C06FA